jgi:outer membrane protein assembly factor BamB
LTALDPATGKVLWSVTAKPNYGAHCTSAVVVSGGLVVTPVYNEVYAFDAQTGQAKWHQTVTRMENGRAVKLSLHELTVTGGVVYTSMQFGILGWQVGTGQQVFEFSGRHIADSRPLRMAAAGGVIYFLGNAELPPEKNLRGGWIYALDIAAKQVLWKHQASKPDQYNPDGTWATQYVVPVEGGLIYENQGVLVKLTQ